MLSFARLVLPILVCLLIAVPSTAAIYVDAAAPGPVHDGKSWSTAFRAIGQAVNSYASGDIWVKTGVYPESVTLRHTLNLYGGFLGHETSASQRLMGAFPTVIDGGKRGRCIDIPPNAWVTVDGVTARRGYADCGAGIRCDTSSIAKIRNCRIEQCVAWQQAGGVYYGKYTQGEMTGCAITRCEAPIGGGGIIEYHSYPTWTRNVIARNHASESGGGLYCPFHSGALLNNCTLAYNTADVNGGGVYAHYGGPITLNNCILAHNSAPTGGGIYGGGGSSQTTLSRCDFFANAGGDFGGAISTPSPSYANTYVDPVFLAPDRDDYNLMLGSPCANQGAFTLGSQCVADRVGVAKGLPEDTPVRLESKVVGLVDGDTTYIQEPERSSAIAVRGLSGFQTGDLLSSVSGTLSTDPSGHRYIAGGSAVLLARGVYTPRPLAIGPEALAAAPGVLVRSWGRAETPSSVGFTLVSGDTQIRVRWSGPPPPAGSTVSADGVYTLVGDFATCAVRGY